MNTKCSFEPLRGSSTSYEEWTRAAPIWDVVVPQQSLTLGVGKRRYAGAIRSSRLGSSQRSRGANDVEPQGEGASRSEMLIMSTMPQLPIKKSKR